MTDKGAREAILAAARAEVAEHGSFSVKAVAARAGVSRQAVHYHFGGTRGLHAALAAEGLAEPLDEEPTRERLIDAAVRVLSTPGAGVASIESIAAEAGLTKGGFYHHFADRTELLRAVAQRISPVDEIVGAMMAARPLGTREALIALASAYYKAMGERTGLIRNLAANVSRDPELATVVFGEIIGRGVPYVLLWFREQIDSWKLRPDVDPSFVIQALFGPVFLSIVLGDRIFERFDAVGIHPAIANVEAYVDFLLAGIGPVESASAGSVGRPVIESTARPATPEVL